MKILNLFSSMVLFLITISSIAFAQDEKSSFDTSIQIKKFSFSYSLEGKNLSVKVDCPISGWVSIGFNPEKKMKSANIIIGYDANGTWKVEDHFGTRSVAHKADIDLGGSVNIDNASCIELNGITSLIFTIPLLSGDQYDGKINIGEETTVIFAAGKKDSFRSKHSMTAKTKIVFE